jgi:hypothetical protein
MAADLGEYNGSMAGITLAIATERLNDYLDAELKILSGQEKTIGTRTLKRADLGEVRAGIEMWNRRVQDLNNRISGRGRGVTLRPNF